MASLLARQVRAWNRRARLRGLPHTLSIRAWEETIAFFNGCCAYCGGPYETMDHYLSLMSGGGTTAANCLPSCLQCNQQKGFTHPDHLAIFILADRLTTIQQFVAERLQREREYQERMEQFNRWYIAQFTLNDLFEQYCQDRKGTRLDTFRLLLEYTKMSGTHFVYVKDLRSQLHDALRQAGDEKEIALYQDALQFLESAIQELGWNERPELIIGKDTLENNSIQENSGSASDNRDDLQLGRDFEEW